MRFALEPDLMVVGEAGDGETALALTAQLQPDVVVMDVEMPHMDGIEAARRICGLCAHTRIVMLTIYHTAEHVRHALQAGASGYVLKDSAGQELVTAVRALHAGGSYFSSKIDRFAGGDGTQTGKK